MEPGSMFTAYGTGTPFYGPCTLAGCMYV